MIVGSYFNASITFPNIYMCPIELWDHSAFVLNFYGGYMVLFMVVVGYIKNSSFTCCSKQFEGFSE